MGQAFHSAWPFGKLAEGGVGVEVAEVWVSNDIRTSRFGELWLNVIAIREAKAG
jgi:hypothetical protein